MSNKVRWVESINLLENLKEKNIIEIGPGKILSGLIKRINKKFNIMNFNKISDIENEQFGPILHILKYKSSEIDELIEQINKSGYGLTMGLHTRIESRADYLSKNANVGNIYINRDMVGAVVGSQPDKDSLKAKGTVLVFPSFLCHEVTPVTKGIRKSLVSWIEGPMWK